MTPPLWSARRGVSCRHLVVLLLATAFWPIPAAAQFPLRLRAELESENATGKPLVASGILPVPGADERALREKLRLARAYADNASDTRNHSQAAALYQNILESLENTAESGLQHDYFLPPEKEEKAGTATTVTATLRGEIDAAFAQLPPEVWRTYQLRTGTTAQRLLDEALAAGDRSQVEKVYRLYFYTEAGYQAAFLLGEAYLEENQPLSAVSCFLRLKNSPSGRRFEPGLSVKLAASQYLAGNEQQALATLEGLRKAFPGVRLSLGGRTVHGPGLGQQGLTWLGGLVGKTSLPEGDRRDQWLVHRGNAGRNALGVGDEPVAVRWQTRTSDNPLLVDEREGVIPHLARRWEKQGQLALPSAQPLVLRRSTRGDSSSAVVVVRTVGALTAIDLATGKRVLRADEPEPAMIEGTSAGGFDPFGRAVSGSSADSLERRLWGDGALGQISSDGQRVYQIKRAISREEAEADEEAPRPRRGLVGGGPPAGRPGNILQALSLSGSRGDFPLAWQIDGTSEPEQSPLAGATFLGPPLPMRSVLYVLAEFTGATAELTSGDTRLLAIDPNQVDGRGRPKLLWSQRIAQFDDAVGSAMHGEFRGLGLLAGGRSLRRQVGLSPSAADGLVVCPTGVGAVVAVDVSTRSLRWGFKYPVGGAAPDPRVERRRGGNTSDWPHWVDASLTIADSRVLVTSPLSQRLHCLNLADGKELWSVPREDGLYVAGVRQGNVIVVGGRTVRAWQLSAADPGGKPAWSQMVELPSTSKVAGRGLLTAEHYYLPVSTAEIAVIDLAKGQIVKQLRSPEGRPLGNLIGYGDALVSIGPASIDCFEQREALQASVRERLTKNPGDFAALRDDARRALHDGKLEEAVTLLRRSHQARPDPLTKELLVAGLMQLVKTDAAKHRALLTELAGLVERRTDRAAYLRLLADAQRRDGKQREALETLLQLATALGDRHLAQGDVTRSSAAAVEIALAELYQACPADQRVELDQVIEKARDAAISAKSPRELRRFLERYGFHRSASKVRQELIARAISASSAVDRSAIALTRAGGSDEDQPPTLAEALWLLGNLEQSADKTIVGWAVAHKARLLAQSGQVEDAAEAYRRLRAELAEQVCLDGKTGQQLFSELPPGDAVRRRLEKGAPSWPIGEVTTETAAGSPAMRTLFAVPLEGTAPWCQSTTLHFNPTSHLLLARDGLGKKIWEIQLDSPSELPQMVTQAMAVGHLLVLQAGDEVIALDVLRRDRPMILWRRALADGPLGRQGTTEAQLQLWALRDWSDQFASIATPTAGRLSLVTSRYVCWRHDETLTAVHPLTGRTLWTRRGVPSGARLFGDDELLALHAAAGESSLVIRAADGELVAQPKLGQPSAVVGAVGSKLIAWDSRDGKQTLRVLDAHGKELTRLGEFAPGSKVAIVKQDSSEQDSVAVLQPSGELALVRIADGKEQFRRKGLQLPPRLDRLYIARYGNAYFMAVSRPDEDGSRQWILNPERLQWGRDSAVRPSVNGQVYGLSRTGADLWKDGPSRVEGCQWALDQPAELPVLVFLSDESSRGGQMRIKLVDKRTGRTIYDHRRPAQPQTLELQGDAEQGQIVMQLPGSKVTLKFGGAAKENPKTDGSAKPSLQRDEPPKDAPSTKQPKG